MCITSIVLNLTMFHCRPSDFTVLKDAGIEPRTSVVDPDPGSSNFLTRGSRMGKKSGSRIQDEHPRSFFRELRNVFVLKI